MSDSAARRADLALLALGGIGVARLFLSIALLAVDWAVGLRGDDPEGGSMTLNLWRALTSHGVVVADLSAAVALIVLARAATRRVDSTIALVSAVGWLGGALALGFDAPATHPLAVTATFLGPATLAAWLAMEATRLRRLGLLTASALLALIVAARAALPAFATLQFAEGAPAGLVIPVHAEATLALALRVEHALLAALPLLALLHRRAGRRLAEAVRPLPEPRWRSVELALGSVRHALVSKALIAAGTVSWAIIFGAGPSLPGPAMIASAAAGFALASLWTLWALTRWLGSPARSPATWAAALATAAALVAEVTVSVLGWTVAQRFDRDLVYTHDLVVSIAALVGANLATFLFLVAALHRLALKLGVDRPARTLARVGVLALVAFAVPWTAWLGRGLALLLDPWALGAVLFAGIALWADLAVLTLVMNDLERRLRRGREAAGVAARF